MPIDISTERARIEAWLRFSRGTDNDLFPLSDWRDDVANGDTGLGADAWWEAQLEQQLGESEWGPIFEAIRRIPAMAEHPFQGSEIGGIQRDLNTALDLLYRQGALLSPDQLIGPGFAERIETFAELLADIDPETGLPEEVRTLAEQLEADITAAFDGPAPWLAADDPGLVGSAPG